MISPTFLSVPPQLLLWPAHQTKAKCHRAISEDSSQEIPSHSVERVLMGSMRHSHVTHEGAEEIPKLHEDVLWDVNTPGSLLTHSSGVTAQPLEEDFLNTVKEQSHPNQEKDGIWHRLPRTV